MRGIWLLEFVQRMGDHEALDQLMRRAARSIPGYSEELHAHPEAFQISTVQIQAGRVLVAESDGAIAGFAIWRPIGDLTAELEAIFVDPPLWGGGTANELMRVVCDAVIAGGHKNLFVTAVPAVAEFYRRSGFVRTGATSTPLGPAITMMKEIAVR